MTRDEINTAWRRRRERLLVLEATRPEYFTAVQTRNREMREVLHQMIDITTLVPDEIIRAMKEQEQRMLEELKQRENEGRLESLWPDFNADQR